MAKYKECPNCKRFTLNMSTKKCENNACPSRSVIADTVKEDLIETKTQNHFNDVIYDKNIGKQSVIEDIKIKKNKLIAIVNEPLNKKIRLFYNLFSSKRKTSEQKGRTHARKLIEEIIYTVDLEQGAREIRQSKVDRLVDLGPEIVPMIANVINSVIDESHTEHYSNAGELCVAIGRIGGDLAFDLLIDYFNRKTNIWEYNYIRKGAARGLGQLGDTRAVLHLSEALTKGGATDALDNAIEESLKQLGSEPPLTVSILVKRFVRSECVKQEPDFKDFSMTLRQFPKTKRGVAWWQLGWALREKGYEQQAQKCFIKSLTINPGPEFAAWGALRPPINDYDERTLQTLEKLKQKIGVIVDD